jgi:hypothetical protein
LYLGDSTNAFLFLGGFITPKDGAPFYWLKMADDSERFRIELSFITITSLNNERNLTLTGKYVIIDTGSPESSLPS